MEGVEWKEFRCGIGDGGEQPMGKIPLLTGVLERVGSLSNTRQNPVFKSLDREDVELDFGGLELDGKQLDLD